VSTAATRTAPKNLPVFSGWKQLLYGLQTASHNLRYANFDPVLERPLTTDVPLDDAAAHVEAGGSPALPPKKDASAAGD
jgi:hypothetical protein